MESPLNKSAHKSWPDYKTNFEIPTHVIINQALLEVERFTQGILPDAFDDYNGVQTLHTNFNIQTDGS